MSKQNFLGLVKVTGSITNYDNITDRTGKLIFAQVTDDNNVTKYIINANGIEYNIATAEVFNDLGKRVKTLEDWKKIVDGTIGNLVTKDTEIDSSITELKTSVSALEEASAALAERIADVSQDVIDISTYVHETVDTSINNISTRLSNIGITAADNKLTVNGKDISLSRSDYVTVTAANNSVNVSLIAEKIQDGNSGVAGHEKLATKGYVDNQMSACVNALVFKGPVDSSNPLPTNDQKVGDTYVAASNMSTPKADAGDLFIWNGTGWTQVERNLDGAVEAGAALGADYVILGNGNQEVKASTLSITALNTAIANANSALQNVTASTLSNFVTVAAAKDASTVNVSVGVTTHDVSTATTNTNGLATALGVKEYVDAQAGNIEVKATLNSSTPNYVEASAFVDGSGRVISASVGVKVATLADASNGSIGLAMAKDVYTELTTVEQTMTTANATMANAIGLDENYSVKWSGESGITANASTIVKAIEEVAKKVNQSAQSGVTEFGGATGAISIDTTNNIDGSVNFAMAGSTLTGTVNGWRELKNRVAAAETSIGDVSARVKEVNTDLNDLSTYVRTTVDPSVNALEVEVANHKVKSIEGETGITKRANDEFVAVSATKDDKGNVTLDSSIQLAENVELTGITGATKAQATGLATDATVKDYVAYALAWDVIGDV